MTEWFIEWYPQIMMVEWTFLIGSFIAFTKSCLPIILS